MICTPCQIQADQGLFGPESHSVCLGKSWCDCQHVEVTVNEHESEADSEVRESVSVSNENL